MSASFPTWLFRICVSKGDDARHGQRPLFGSHFVADIPGTIHVGDDITVVCRHCSCLTQSEPALSIPVDFIFVVVANL